MAPKVVALLVARCASLCLCAAAFACSVRAPDVSFTPFVFLESVLFLELLWNGPRILYDAAQVLFQVPLPPQHMALSALVAAEWVAMLELFAAAWSSGAVVVFLEIDIRACEWVPAGACSHWHRASAALAMVAWFFSGIVSILMFWIRACVAHQD
ncbi:hypothetical protein QOZ80_2AG0105970 [Eleusine coracana subsp. coracana]|nr:hypothetical protein QOZ80_2AG0105970 [Eleusine coracana subsp. coracana]